jgi:hypothetical protein
MKEITIAQYELVYNSLSFGIAAMGAATLFLWLSRNMVSRPYQTAITISGLVTAIALYHYLRIFNSWGSSFMIANDTVTPTGVKFNDAYRYVD